MKSLSSLCYGYAQYIYPYCIWIFNYFSLLYRSRKKRPTDYVQWPKRPNTVLSIGRTSNDKNVQWLKYPSAIFLYLKIYVCYILFEGNILGIFRWIILYNLCCKVLCMYMYCTFLYSYMPLPERITYFLAGVLVTASAFFLKCAHYTSLFALLRFPFLCFAFMRGEATRLTWLFLYISFKRIGCLRIRLLI